MKSKLFKNNDKSFENYKSYFKSKFKEDSYKEEEVHDLKPLYIKKVIIKEPEINDDKLSLMQYIEKYKII